MVPCQKSLSVNNLLLYIIIRNDPKWTIPPKRSRNVFEFLVVGDVDFLRGGFPFCSSLSLPFFGSQNPIGLLFPCFLLIHCKLFLFDSLELVPEVELSSLLLELGKLILIFRNLLQCWLDEFSSEIINRNVKLIDLIIFDVNLMFQVIFGIL